MQITKQQPAKQNFTLLDTVMSVLENHTGMSSDQLTAKHYENNEFEDDDPAKRRDIERLMEYMDTFNEMMNAEEYDQAAKHAANSPKGVLRTYNIMNIFKGIQHNAADSPQMMFCNALMATADSSELMPGALSCEIVRCALDNKRIDLASFWISKNCFKVTVLMGDLLLEYCECEKFCSCGIMLLAKELYHKLGAHGQAAFCLLSTGKIHQMIQYSEDHHFTIHDYMFLCKRYPHTELLIFLMSAHPEIGITGKISFAYAVKILLESERFKILSEILKEVYENGILSADDSRKFFTELLFAESAEDGMSPEKWNQIVEFCISESMNEVAEELLAVLAVRKALDFGTYWCIMNYIS